MPIKNKARALTPDFIAACGMNCRLCLGFIRKKNTCPGCRNTGLRESEKSEYRNRCRIKNCNHITSEELKYCSNKCEKFPCRRLKELDKRYSTKYNMSMLENLDKIAESGIRQFIREEKEKWTCPDCGEFLCVHRPICLSCGYNWKNN